MSFCANNKGNEVEVSKTSLEISYFLYKTMLFMLKGKLISKF
jgi:hypothetical protein